MNHLDLFSGIGGFALAAKWVWGEEHNIVSFVEIDPFCQKVLKKHWPDVPIHDDIRTYKHGGTNVDLLTGGFPCQGFSVAGEQKGKEDDRYLWPEMLEVIRKVYPTWIIGENVAGIINLALDTVLSDLENKGYTTESFIIPACGVDAPHKRYRVWFVAHNECLGREKGAKQGIQPKINKPERSDTIDICQNVSNSTEWDDRGKSSNFFKEEPRDKEIGKEQGETAEQWQPEPNVGRVAHGVPNRVDRLKSLGNAIVPQVVVPIMQAIKAIDG